MSKLDKIKSSLKRITDPVIRERLLMVQATYKESLREVAKTFWLHAWKAWIIGEKDMAKMGLKGLKTKPRSGRPSLITKSRQKKYVHDC